MTPRPPKRGPRTRDSIPERVEVALSLLRQKSTGKDRSNLQRFGITATQAFGVSMSNIQSIARQCGTSHELALALWKTGWYEARLLAAFVDDPAFVTPAQMERWCKDFDNWGICDTLCFKLFDRTPHAWKKVEEWQGRAPEFVKRAAFALIASLALHDKASADEPFRQAFHFIEEAAADDRNFVKKGVSWALRTTGRRNSELHREAVALAKRLAESAEPSARWIGRDALRDLTGRVVMNKLESAKQSKKSHRSLG